MKIWAVADIPSYIKACMDNFGLVVLGDKIRTMVRCLLEIMRCRNLNMYHGLNSISHFKPMLVRRLNLALERLQPSGVFSAVFA